MIYFTTLQHSLIPVIIFKVVYFEEKPIRPIDDLSISCRTHCVCPPGTKRKCTARRDIPGSNAFVPSTVGLIIASKVIKDLTSK